MSLFSKTKGTSLALIDINSGSVAGGFVHIEEGRTPSMCYTARISFGGATTPETLTGTMIRALDALGDRLVREGAPALRAATGKGSVDHIIVSIANPWQETAIETKNLQPERPFTFTKKLIDEALGKDLEPSEKIRTQSVVAVTLNGYTLNDPYGKTASRAEIVVLSSSIEKHVLDAVEKKLHQTFHARDIRYNVFADSAYRVLKSLYPHEKDFLMLSLTQGGTVIASAKRNHLIDIGSLSYGMSELRADPKAWGVSIAELLKGFATRHALPRTLFLVAETGTKDLVAKALDEASLHALWLSDEPVSIIPLEPSQFTSHLKVTGQAEGDTRLAILALYATQ